MNASDIVTSKQNCTLHKAYYPLFSQSTIYSTLYPYSSFATGSTPPYSTSYTSTINTLYTYEPSETSVPPIPFISYQLSRDIETKKISNMEWEANPLISTTPVYTSSYNVITSDNSRVPRPLICISSYKQGTSFENTN